MLPDDEALDHAVGEVIEQLMASAPEAVGAAKQLVRKVMELPPSEIDRYTAGEIARLVG